MESSTVIAAIGLEDKVLEIILYQYHYLLAIGIFCFLAFLKKVTPVAKFLFTDKWNWLVPIINLALSVFGIFVLGMTNVTTNGLKAVIALVITAITAYTYESFKTLLEKIGNKIFKNGNTPPTTPPTNPNP